MSEIGSSISDTKEDISQFLEKDDAISKIIFVAIGIIVALPLMITAAYLSATMPRARAVLIYDLIYELTILFSLLYAGTSTMILMYYCPKNSGRTPADYTADCLLRLNRKSPTMIRA
ncbi:MAG: hypothetical protein QRY74_02185 [Chlamydia sp.]